MSNVKIPFMDLSAQYAAIEPEITSVMAEVIAANAYIRGPFVEQFEEDFAAYSHTNHCIGVANGTDALFLALKAMGIGPDHEVLVPAMTFVATSEAVTMAGATPVFVDIDPVTFTLDPDAMAKKISPRTKAVIPVHLYGHPADMKSIRKLADHYNLKIIQDGAQAHGATIGDTPIATFGDCTCFSFYPGKNLGAYGDAGGVVTNDETLAQQIRMLANHGRKSKYDHEFEGVNSRMDGLQGGVLSVKLKYLDTWTDLRRTWAGMYDNALKDLDGVATPTMSNGIGHAYQLYVILAEDRDALRAYLADRGIATGVH